MLLTWLSMWHGTKVGGSGLRLVAIVIGGGLAVAGVTVVTLALRGLLQALGLS